MKLLNILVTMSLLSATYMNIVSKDCYETEFLKACENGQKKKVLKEIARGININCTDSDQRTGLILATINNKEKICTILINTQNVNIKHKDKYSWTAQMYATHHNHKKIKDLLEKAQES